MRNSSQLKNFNPVSTPRKVFKFRSCSSEIENHSKVNHIRDFLHHRLIMNGNRRGAFVQSPAFSFRKIPPTDLENIFRDFQLLRHMTLHACAVRESFNDSSNLISMMWIHERSHSTRNLSNYSEFCSCAVSATDHET